MAAIGQPPAGPIDPPDIVPFPVWGNQGALDANHADQIVPRKLPDFTSLNPPLTISELHDSLKDPFNGRWDSRTPAEWLGKYQRVANGKLDNITPGNTSTHKFTMDSLENCHNGLLRLRTGHSNIQLPDESELCQLAFRLLAWSQEHAAAARMGGLKSAGRTWWLAAAPFTLEEPTSAGNTPLTIFNLDLAGADASIAAALSYKIPAGEGTKAGFEAAIFSLHPVHLKNNHFSLIILHKTPPDPALAAANQAPWRYWYLDSQSCCWNGDGTGKTAAEWRSSRAIIAAGLLTQFLTNSGVNIPGKVLQRAADVVMTPQLEPFTCGLHVVANIIAFIRFERIGWDRVNNWCKVKKPADRTKIMEKSLIRSLHNIMGLKLGRNGVDKYLTGLYAPKEGEPGVFPNRDGYGAKKGERKQVARPAKTPRGSEQSGAREAGGGIKRGREEDGSNEEERQAKRSRGDDEGGSGQEGGSDQEGGSGQEGGGGIKRGREYDGDDEEPPAKRARGDEVGQASNTAEGEAAVQETGGCRCANPRREQGVESAEVRETEPGDLAVRAWDRDVPLARPARRRLADLNWQTMRTIRFNRAIYGDHSENVRREREEWENPRDIDESIIEETLPNSVEEAINTTVDPVDDAEEVFQEPADAP